MRWLRGRASGDSVSSPSAALGFLPRGKGNGSASACFSFASSGLLILFLLGTGQIWPNINISTLQQTIERGTSLVSWTNGSASSRYYCTTATGMRHGWNGTEKNERASLASLEAGLLLAPPSVRAEPIVGISRNRHTHDDIPSLAVLAPPRGRFRHIRPRLG